MILLDGQCIAQFDDIINAKNVVDIVNAKISEGKISYLLHSGVEEKRKNDTIPINDAFSKSCDDLGALYFNIAKAIHESVSEYKKKFEIEETLYPETLTYVRYQVSDKYSKHYDGGTVTNRSVSAVLYLTDDYSGGEIEFINQGIKVRPKAGTLLVFPANYAYTHIAHPVTDGNKIIITAFYQDFKNGQQHYAQELFSSI